jgi:hypothetical protein
MISITESLISKDIGKTTRSLRGSGGRRGTNHNFWNNLQRKPMFREPGMAKVGGQRPRQPPIQCWGCKGDHKYRYFPHISDKVRFFHNVQQEEIVEDMRSRIPRIYAALDNKKDEFQSNMIEVECMINNHA